MDFVEIQMPIEGCALRPLRRELIIEILAPASTLEVIDARLATDPAEGTIESKPVLCGLLYCVFEEFALRNSQTVVGGFGIEFQGSYRRKENSIEITMQLLPKVQEKVLEVIFAPKH